MYFSILLNYNLEVPFTCTFPLDYLSLLPLYSCLKFYKNDKGAMHAMPFKMYLRTPMIPCIMPFKHLTLRIVKSSANVETLLTPIVSPIYETTGC